MAAAGKAVMHLKILTVPCWALPRTCEPVRSKLGTGRDKFERRKR